MITKSELISTGRLKGLTNVGYMEKDYFLDLVLFSISRNTKNGIVFKGGTCMYKIYGFERFSEDLDFSEVRDTNLELLIQKILSDLDKFGIEASISKRREPFNSVLYNLKIRGPLYAGKPQTSCSIRIDINRKSSVELSPLSTRFSSLYHEIPSFYALVMQEKEILAEKIRALMTRNKARDLYDVWALVDKGIEIDWKIVKNKLEYYNLRFGVKGFLDSINRKEAIWETEMKPLVRTLPDFNSVKSTIRKSTENQS